MLRRIGLVLALTFTLALLLAGCSMLPGQSSGVDWQVEVSGAVDKPTTVSYDDLLKMKQNKLQDVLMRKSRGEDEKTNWEGPSIADVLAVAKPKANATGVTVMAADGYAIQIPMADLANGVVALKQSDKRIVDAGQGAVRLVIPDKPANFWVLGFKKIKVEDTPIVAPTPKPDVSPTPKP